MRSLESAAPYNVQFTPNNDEVIKPKYYFWKNITNLDSFFSLRKEVMRATRSGLAAAKATAPMECS